MTARWLFKKILGLLPQKKICAPDVLTRCRSVGYLFAGTYGDFVQCIDVLKELADLPQKPEVYLLCERKYYDAFSPLLPNKIIYRPYSTAIFWPVLPRDLVMSNVIGMYRFHFDLIMYFAGKASLGYCYGNEKGRKQHSFSYRLSGNYVNYTAVNLQLLRLPEEILSSLAQPVSRPSSVKSPFAELPTDDIRLSEIAEKKSTAANRVHKPIHLSPAIPGPVPAVLFHIGSAGLKKELGLEIYTKWIRIILAEIKKKARPQIIFGSDDKDVAALLGLNTSPISSLKELKNLVDTWPGPVLCFNSFMAHFTYFLGIKSVVLHLESVPQGYDCGDLHHQLVFKPADVLNPAETKRILEALNSSF